MKKIALIVAALTAVGVSQATSPRATAQLRAPSTESGDSGTLRVLLLGTLGGPVINTQRFGIATLVVAGPEKLLFDAGRSVTTAMARVSISPVDVTKVFLTHLHSDHIVGLPELYLFPWASQGRSARLNVWGPDGTRSMMKHLQNAFEYDIHIRRDVDERFSAEGITVNATDIHEGAVYEANGVKVTAFLVDHGPVKPAFGYRVDYRGHSVVMSGDTKPSDNLVQFSRPVDVLIHEVGRWKNDPALEGSPNERMPGGVQTREEARRIADHHSDPVEAGQVFQKVKPKLAVFSHWGAATTTAILPLVRQNYTGPIEFGEDGMIIEIGDGIDVRRSQAPSK